MTTIVLSREMLDIAAQADVAIVRRKIRQLAEALSYDQFSLAALTTATTELCRNIWENATKVRAIVEKIGDDHRAGIRVVFQDDGPGISELDRVLVNELGASGRRLVDEFRIETTVGKGTVITVVKWKPTT